jgi:hypothetical protein
MIWDCFAYTSPGALAKVNSIINFTHYLDILAQNIVASAKRGHKWIFQQDNNPKCTSTSTKKALVKIKSNQRLFVTCAKYNRCRPNSEMLSYRPEPTVQFLSKKNSY